MRKQSKPQYFVKHDTTQADGQKIAGAYLTHSLTSRFQMKKALRKALAKHPDAYGSKEISFY